MGYDVVMGTRFYRHMSAEERLGLAHGYSLRTMASVLGRAPSTVSCELARNLTRGLPYVHLEFETAEVRPVLQTADFYQYCLKMLSCTVFRTSPFTK